MSGEDFNLESFIPFRVHQASEAVSQSFRNIYRDEFGMTRSEWRVFAHLGQYGSMTATEIGKSASLHKTKVSRALMALEKRRWLIREADENDRRVQRLGLTKAGLKAFGQLGTHASQYNLDLTKRLGEKDAKTLLRMMEKLLKSVD